MYILLSGKPALQKSVAEAIRTYYTYRGTACYIYDYLRPVVDAHDAALSSLSRFKIFPPGTYREDLADKIYNWLAPAIPDITRKELHPVVHKWDLLKMFYIAVIYHVPWDSLADLVSPSFTVRFREVGEQLAPNFDLFLDIEDPIQAANAIGYALHDSLFGVAAEAPKDGSSTDTEVAD